MLISQDASFENFYLIWKTLVGLLHASEPSKDGESLKG
jgi:hypothetical protein